MSGGTSSWIQETEMLHWKENSEVPAKGSKKSTVRFILTKYEHSIHVFTPMDKEMAVA